MNRKLKEILIQIGYGAIIGLVTAIIIYYLTTKI